MRTARYALIAHHLITDNNPKVPFSGEGRTLHSMSMATPTVNSAKGKGKADENSCDGYSWGSSGQTLGSRPSASHSTVGQGTRGDTPPRRNAKMKQKERSPTPDWGVDDDDVIMIDSD
jgi:ubiquitin fusion degradation protein 1